MENILAFAKEYGLFVLEDVAQAFGGKWKDKKLGSIGTAGAFSFFPSKNLGGFGDGGMIATNDDEAAGLMRMLIKHGGKDKYNVDHIGYNARLDTLQAAIILAKLKYIDEFNDKRRKIADLYNQVFDEIGNRSLVPPASSNNAYHVYHQYTVRVENGRRDDFQKYLKSQKISSMIYYPQPLHNMKVFGGRSIVFETLPESEKAVKEVISLPMEPLMTRDVISMVSEIIKKFPS